MGRSLKGPHSPGSDSVHSAEQFLLARINYERMQVMPYHERLLKLDRLRRLLALARRATGPGSILRRTWNAWKNASSSTAAR